jgi:hypothetical protein
MNTKKEYIAFRGPKFIIEWYFNYKGKNEYELRIKRDEYYD